MSEEESSGSPPESYQLPQELICERVLLRPYQIGDVAALLEAYAESREHLRPWIGRVDEIQTLGDAEAAVKQRRAAWFQRKDLVVGIFDRGTGRYLGESGLGPYWESLEYELGFWLRASAEGHGYMTEANRLLCDWAFTQLSAVRSASVHVL